MIHTTTSPLWPQLNGRSQRVANSVSLPERRTLLRTRSPSFSQELGCGFGRTRSPSSSPVAALGTRSPSSSQERGCGLGCTRSRIRFGRTRSPSSSQERGCGFGRTRSPSSSQERGCGLGRTRSPSSSPRARLRLTAHSLSLLLPRTLSWLTKGSSSARKVPRLVPCCQ